MQAGQTSDSYSKLQMMQKVTEMIGHNRFKREQWRLQKVKQIADNNMELTQDTALWLFMETCLDFSEENSAFFSITS